MELSQQAINQALAGNWQAAVDLNQEILKQNPEDIDALCRLAKAFSELDKKNLALKTYKNILKLDKFNPIAKKNLAKFSTGTLPKEKKEVEERINPGLFLEEPGKTKVVSLIRLGLPKILLQLNISYPVKLIPRKRSVSVYYKKRCYLGKIPDNLSLRLIKLMKSGNQYKAVVKSVTEKSLSIFIKEDKQSKKNANIPSFPLSKEQYYSFLPRSVVERGPIEEIERLEE